MKNQIVIRTFKMLSIPLSLTLFFSSCSMFKESPQEKTNIVTIDAKTGESTLHKETDYVSKSESLQIEVNNYNPMMDSIVFNKLERNINSNGGELSDILIGLQNKINVAQEGNNQTLKETHNNRIDEDKKRNEPSKTFNKKEFDKLTQEEDILSQLEMTIKESQNLLKRLDHISSEEDLAILISEGENLLDLFNKSTYSLIDDQQISNSLKIQITETKTLINEAVQFIRSISFKKFLPFEAKKEETEIEVSIYKKSTKQLVCSYNHTFITKNHFKMSGSVGAHVIITDGSVNNAFKNVDSLIVSRRISNIQPSFGTYMNGTWRVNDALVGFGLGLGVPVDGQDNLSPNFSVFFTSLFQTEYGRFGFNVGAAIRQTRILAPGYELGSNLGNASIDVPTISTWKPGLMFGVSYVIGGKEKE